MSHKERVRHNCMEYLQSRQLSYCFNEQEFNRIYRKSTPQGNAFSIGLDAADYMILTYKPTSHDTGNDD